MTTTLDADISAPPAGPPPGSPRDAGRFARRAAGFVAVGLLVYMVLYAGSEWLVREHANRNRFHVVQSAAEERYDFVILGASHAAVFDYRDMNERLEEMTGAEILNLATVGGGITINRVLLEYFFQDHRTDAVVYVTDSFAFYSPEWNEERVLDTELYTRAPWDPGLAGLLVRNPATRGAALGYVSGFSKINNRDRFGPDLFDAEGSTFDRSYRPIAQIDRQRMAFLYPEDITATSLETSPYVQQFEELIEYVESMGARFIIVRPPIPPRIYEMLPFEAEFEAALRDLAAEHGAELVDYTNVNNDRELFYDSDHLNQDGVLRLYEDHMAAMLRAASDG